MNSLKEKPELISIYDSERDLVGEKPVFPGSFAVFDNFNEEVFGNFLKIYSVFLCSSIPS